MNRILAAVGLVSLAVLPACGGGGSSGGGASAGSATVTATLKDAATDGWLSFGVDVVAVDLVGDNGATVALFPPADQPGARLPVDLLSLRGESRILSSCPVPPGRYLGFVFSYANAQALAAGALAAAPPGANAAGTVRVDFPVPVALGDGESGILDIDFDLDASLAGGINGFQPVVRCDFVDEDTTPPPDWQPPVIESLSGAILGLYPEKSAFEIELLGGVPVPMLGTWDAAEPVNPILPRPIPLGRKIVFLTEKTVTTLPDGTTLTGNGRDVFAALAPKMLVEVAGRLAGVRAGGVIADTVTVFSPVPEPERFEIQGLVSGLSLDTDPMSLTLMNRFSILPVDPTFDAAGGAALLPPVGGSTRVILTPETRVSCGGWWETDVEGALPLSTLRVGASLNVVGAWRLRAFVAKAIRIQPQSIAGTAVFPSRDLLMPTRGLLVNVDVVEGVPVAQLPGFRNPVLVVRRFVPEPLPVDPPTDPAPPPSEPQPLTAGAEGSGSGIAMPMPVPLPPVPPEPAPGARVRAYGTFCDPEGAFEAYDVQIEWESYTGTAVTDLSLSPPGFTLILDTRMQIQIFPPPMPVDVRVQIHKGTNIVAVGGDPCALCMQPLADGMERPIFIDDMKVLTPEELIALLKSGEFYAVEVQGWRTSDLPRTISASSITVRRKQPWWWDGGGIIPGPAPVPLGG